MIPLFIRLGLHVEFGLKVSYFMLSGLHSVRDLSTGVRSDVKYRVFKKELYNFESLQKFIQRTYTTF
jgi:hypothetical protein